MKSAPRTDVTICLRSAVDEDVDDLAPIWLQGWRDGHLGHVPDELLLHRTEESFRHRLPTRIPSTTVALRHRRPVGFVIVHADEIEQLYVSATARGTGVASALLRHAEETVGDAHHDRGWLAVAPGNARARRFYEREGWRDAGAIDYHAEIAGGAAVLVPCRRYEKVVRRAAGGA